MKKFNKLLNRLGIARIIIILFFIALCILAVVIKLPISMLLSETIMRTGMYGILVLAMVPGIISGTGLNFGIPIGIICGLVGGLYSIEFNLNGFTGFFTAVAISIPLAAAIGYGYGLLINKVKGSEMMVGTYMGFSAVSLMCIGWLLIPFNSPAIKWPIGKGVRVTISLSERYAKVLNNFMNFKIGEVEIPTGLILFLFINCLFMWIFLRSKSGVTMKAAGDNPKFAEASGINVDKCRLRGIILPTVLGAEGIIVYAQSYGFYQLYQSPMMMGFPAVASILIGGASTNDAKISHVLVGTFLFQGLLVMALPITNEIVKEGDLSEIVRIIVSNGIILYALTKAGGGEECE